MNGKLFGTFPSKANHTFCKCSNCLQLFNERVKYEKQTENRRERKGPLNEEEAVKKNTHESIKAND